MNLPNRPLSSDRPLGIALVGLGKYATTQIVPAVAAAPNLRLAGAVTSDVNGEGRALAAAQGFDPRSLYTYDGFDRIANDDAIDIVYVTLPNNLHAEFVVRAARAGKHVICEKPMAITAEECQRMIAACERARVQLGIGYRLHYDPNHLHLMRLVRSGTYGRVRAIRAGFSADTAPNWRLDKAAAGGGPLMDLGIYCLNAACYVLDEDPVAVRATEGPKTQPERFPTIEQSMRFELDFGSGVTAQCHTSYAEEEDYLHVETEQGVLRLAPAFYYDDKRLQLPDGSDDTQPNLREQTLQLDDFARCIQTGRPVRVPGQMGLRDVLVIEALYRAMASGHTETVPYPEGWQPVGELALAAEAAAPASR